MVAKADVEDDMIIYRGYQIKPDRQTPQHSIVVTDGKGGKIPDCLGGLFTTPTIAKKAIDDYLLSKQPKGKDNGETIDKSGG